LVSGETVTGQSTQDVQRYNLNDPASMQRLDGLSGEFGVSLSEFLSDNFGQLLEDLSWRKTASAGEADWHVALHVFLDLCEGDEIILATIRTGEISAFGHNGLAS
jgi:hypothetical protein